MSDEAPPGPESHGVARGSDVVREHLANERTLLAWARTSMALMGLGFVVSRFGLLLRELRQPLSHLVASGFSTAVGTFLVLAGAALMAMATWRYLGTGRAIDAHAYRWSPGLGLVMAGLLLLVGLVLAAYLLVTA